MVDQYCAHCRRVVHGGVALGTGILQHAESFRFGGLVVLPERFSS